MSLRVGSGAAKGRRLWVPRGEGRFSSGRTKKGMFDFLAPRLEGARVLDLFAGAGGLGIEALSRGAGFCLFVDAGFSAAAVLKKNLASLFPPQRYEVRRRDFRRALEKLFAEGERFDLVLADPPYQQDFLDGLAQTWRRFPVLKEEGVFALEHSKRQKFPAPENLVPGEIRKYGDTMVSYFRAR
jgi:16S rRNA (guanine(966)-N(2))-methyltransferase RsmD